MRLPNPRYIGDGVYVRHDGHSLIVETSNGITVLNSIALEGSALEGLNQYIEYVGDYYRNNQHKVRLGCEQMVLILDDLLESLPESQLRRAVLDNARRVIAKAKGEV